MIWGSEERKHKRLPTTYIVRYKPRHSQNDYSFSQTNNVSQGGTVMLTKRHFYESTQLELHIQFPFAHKRLEVIGEVIACKEILKDSSYETRLKFVEMSTELKLQIADIIERRRQMGQK